MRLRLTNAESGGAVMKPKSWEPDTRERRGAVTQSQAELPGGLDVMCRGVILRLVY